jgi:predicted nucleic acid-binding protein
MFLADNIYLRYREKGDAKFDVFADFFIGAHAAVAGIPLLTRDLRRYRTYFPKLELISPQAVA